MAHELSHHFLEHEFNDVLLSDDGCRKVDKKKEKEANFLAAELLIPYQAALKAAFAEKSNEEVAATFGVSTQFAQMCMKGARVHAQHALAKQARTGRRWRGTPGIVVPPGPAAGARAGPRRQVPAAWRTVSA
jgi:Zn-dependent peptidase ImmA (M78 family)